MHRDLGLDTRPRSNPDGEAQQPIAAGDRVHVSSWGQEGTVLEDLGDNVLVQIGAMRMTAPKSDVVRRGVTLRSAQGDARGGRGNKGAGALRQAQGDNDGAAALEAATTATTEIDVRGKRFVEAEPIVERWIDDAVMLGHSPLRLIHGKGTGLLGKGLQEYLKAHPFVQNVRYGHADEGGGGVTVFELRSPTT
jgi:DNA mismatch repair protein MutS2